MKALFIQFPKCTTCKNALKWLKENGIEVEERSIVEDNPTKEELLVWIEKSGLDYRKFFNMSGQMCREMNIKEKARSMSLEEAVDLLSTNGMLVKRPILVTEDKVLIGFKEDQYQSL